MVTMIMKMSLIVFLYVALTAGLRLWVHTERSVLTFKKRILIGVIYGICAILSTHFGVVYDEMTINVRDAAPLAAGLFFDPVSGIIAGLVGGIERYIAGTYFGVGSYTRVACSISTCLAGFLAAAMNMRIFHGKKPSPFYAFFLGIVTEVFHMYAVLITHRSDMKMAFYVVDTCAKPMMVFTGLSLFFSAIVLYALSGKLKACIQKPKNEDIPISAKFQAWLFICIIFVLTVTFLFSYSVQTRTVLQNTQKTMTINTEDAKTSYKYLRDDYESLQALIKKQTLIMAHAVASAVDYFGGINNMPVEGLESMRDTYGFYEINLIDENGIIVASSNPLNNGFDMASSKQSSAFMGILSGEMAEYAQDFMPIGRDRNISLMYVGVKCSNGMVQVALDRAAMDEYGSEEEYSNLFGNRHIGENGVVYVADESDIIISGDMRGKVIDALGELPDIQKGDAIFYVFTITFVFPLLSKFDNSIKNTIKNAFIMSIRHFPVTLGSIAIGIIVTLLIIYVPIMLMMSIFLLFSLAAFICSQMYVRVFDRYIPKTAESDDTASAEEAGDNVSEDTEGYADPIVNTAVTEETAFKE